MNSSQLLPLLAIALLIPAVLFSAWLFVGWFGAWRLNRNSSTAPDYGFTPWELGVEFEDVIFSTVDGHQLHGWFLPRPSKREAVIVMHGYRGNRSQVLGLSTKLWDAGFNVFLFDFRGRGASTPAPISMGLWEVEDLAAAIDVVEQRVPEAVIGLLGFSMGAVVALLAGNDNRVRAIVADSAFASQRAVLEHVATQDAKQYLRGAVSGRRFLSAIEWWHKRLGKPGFDEIAPEASIDQLDGRPVLFIHGGRDGLVPIEQAQRLVELATEPKEAWFVEDAYHCGAYFVDRADYTRRVRAFFRRTLSHDPDAIEEAEDDIGRRPR